MPLHLIIMIIKIKELYNIYLEYDNKLEKSFLVILKNFH